MRLKSRSSICVKAEYSTKGDFSVVSADAIGCWFVWWLRSVCCSGRESSWCWSWLRSFGVIGWSFPIGFDEDCPPCSPFLKWLSVGSSVRFIQGSETSILWSKVFVFGSGFEIELLSRGFVWSFKLIAVDAAVVYEAFRTRYEMRRQG